MLRRHKRLKGTGACRNYAFLNLIDQSVVLSPSFMALLGSKSSSIRMVLEQPSMERAAVLQVLQLLQYILLRAARSLLLVHEIGLVH